MCCANTGMCLHAQAKAAAAGAPLSLVPPLEEFEGSGAPHVQLGLAGRHQRGNAALAVALAAAWEARAAGALRVKDTLGGDPAAGAAQESGRGLEGVDCAVRVSGGASIGECGVPGRLAAIAARRLPEEYRRGLASCQWPGRAQARPCSL